MNKQYVSSSMKSVTNASNNSSYSICPYIVIYNMDRCSEKGKREIIKPSRKEAVDDACNCKSTWTNRFPVTVCVKMV